MRAIVTLLELHRQGLVLEAFGDKLGVTPRERITAAARALIIENRDGLLQLLRSCAHSGVDVLPQRLANLADAYAERVAIVLEAGDIDEADARRTAAREVSRRFLDEFKVVTEHHFDDLSIDKSIKGYQSHERG